jgi:hypothetical protein
MRTGRAFNLEKRILSLEFRIRNLAYARKWFEDLRANADHLEVAEYEAALGTNQNAIDSLKRELDQVRQQLRGRTRSPATATVAA